MPLSHFRNSAMAELPHDMRKCPSCQGKLVRERRRLQDRLHSVFKPVRRYRCNNFACQWVGNFAVPRAEAFADNHSNNGPGYSDENRSSGRVPLTFVLHMVLVAAGIVFVLVFSNMEPMTHLDADAQAPSPVFTEPVAEQASTGRTAVR